jgi:signal transduction histidine kinase
VLKVDIAPLKNENGNVLGTVLVWHDITQQKEIENMKTEFVSMVSHELRTPLTSIKGYAALLQDPKLGLLTEKQNRAILIINKESDRLTYLINDILDLSKLEAGKIKLNIELVNLEECIDNAASLENVKKKNISFRKRIPKNMPLIHADKGKITQVFTNLISNAAKFTKPKGKIMVVLSNREKDDFIVVKVKDTGIGIAKKHIPNLFNKFYQVESHLRRNVGGTGLGLPIVKEIVTLHRGEISVKSKIKQGTSIIFKLPKSKEKKDEKGKDKK